MPTTYDLLTAADRFMVEAGDLDPDAFEAALCAWLGEAGDKLERIAAWHAAVKARVERDTAQREAYDTAVRRGKADIERAKALAFDLLAKREEMGEAPRVVGVARLQTNGGKAPMLGLDRVDPATLPDDLVVIERRPNADAIRLALAAGREVSGVTVGERGRSVRFE